MTDPDVLEEVGRWLRYAREDLRAAELLGEQDGVPRASCFHAQQAAEKTIKGSLIFLQTDFPRTHNLQLLVNLLPEGWGLSEEPSRLSSLSDWAVESRYPGDTPEATQEDAKAAVEQAREVLQTALEDLESHGYAPDDEEARGVETVEEEEG